MINMTDVEAAAHFMHTLFPPSDTVLFRPIELWVQNGRKRSQVDFNGIEYPCGEASLDLAVRRQLKRAESTRANVFFGVCPRLGGSQRYDQAWAIRTVRALWSDIDDCEPEEALDRCNQAELPPPSALIHSGYGVHPYWLLAQPYEIDDAPAPLPVHREFVDQGVGKPKKCRKYIVEPKSKERIYLDRTKHLVPDLSPKAVHVQDILAGMAAKIGGDHTQDLSRLLRLPGSLNRKDERNGRPPVPCTLVRLDADLRYPIALLEPFARHSEIRKRRETIAQIPLPEPKRKSAKRQDRLNELILRSAIAELGDRSDADFALCCFAVENGITRDDVRERVASVGKFAQEGERYFDLTWTKAEQRVRERNYERAKEQLGRTQVSNTEKASRDGRHHETCEEQADLRQVVLPGNGTRVMDSAREFGTLLAETGSVFVRGGAVMRLESSAEGARSLSPVKAAELPALLEKVAQVSRSTENGLVQAVCSEAVARTILGAWSFREKLPAIHVMTRCPVLIERDGKLVEITGYDRERGILAGDEHTPEIPLDEAVSLILDEMLGEFNFISDGDQARAAAEVVTPSLVFGGLLPGRPPIGLAEADESQAGKGFRLKMMAAAYGHTVTTVTKRKSGVGSLEESFDAALIRGAQFISVDNVRGELDSESLESFLTEDRYAARIPYMPPVEIDPRRVIVMLTSNQAKLTRDLANRSSCVRIRKQHSDYRFRRYREGDILDHVRANWLRFLGAIHTVVRAWHEAGRPRTDTTAHDFRPWARTLDWICQNIIEVGPLLEGHVDAQQRLSSPALTWLRGVALAVKRADRLGMPLRAHDLLDILAEDPSADTTEIAEEWGTDDDAAQGKALKAIGRQMKKCFRQDTKFVTVDAFEVVRQETTDERYRPVRSYTFTEADPAIPPHTRHPRHGSNSEISEVVLRTETINNSRFCGMGSMAGMAGNGGSNAGVPPVDPDEWGEL